LAENALYFAPNYLTVLELQSKAIALPLASGKAILAFIVN